MVVSLIEGFFRSYTDVTIRARDTRQYLRVASGGMQRRLKKPDVRHSQKSPRIKTSDFLGDGKRLSRREISHRARRSKISLSRSASERSWCMNSSSP
jgi:hypothetical protein